MLEHWPKIRELTLKAQIKTLEKEKNEKVTSRTLSYTCGRRSTKFSVHVLFKMNLKIDLLYFQEIRWKKIVKTHLDESAAEARRGGNIITKHHLGTSLKNLCVIQNIVVHSGV